MLSDAAVEKIKIEMARYPDARSAIMPALYIAQEEYGWLPQEAIDEVAAVMDMTSTEVGSVASFYTMYWLEQPGRHVVDFCTDLPCALVGAEDAYHRLRARLGLKDGQQTTPRGTLTLRSAMCLGGCHHAPILLLDNKKLYEEMSDAKLDRLVAELRGLEHAIKR